MCSRASILLSHILAAGIPSEVKALYKTVWEISQKTLIDMAADRGAFIDQSQSFNVHIAKPTFAKLTSMHFYAWKKVSWFDCVPFSSLCAHPLLLHHRASRQACITSAPALLLMQSSLLWIKPSLLR